MVFDLSIGLEQKNAGRRAKWKRKVTGQKVFFFLLISFYKYIFGWIFHVL